MKLQEWAILIQPSPGATVSSHTLFLPIISISIFGLTQSQKIKLKICVTILFVIFDMIMLKSFRRSQLLGIRRRPSSNWKKTQNYTEAFLGCCLVDENPCFHFLSRKKHNIFFKFDRQTSA
jgi:hypothetical protein